MATFLLIIIYIAFIGLGVPDSMFGAAWPAIYSEFQIPLAFQSFVTVIVSAGTIVSSMISARVIGKFGTAKVSAVSTLMTSLALLGYSFSGNLIFLCIMAVPLGLGAGSIDVALNNYVSLHYSATQMSFLHCFYGIGVSVSPFILSKVINGSMGWRGGYRIGSGIQLAIALLLFLTIPVWTKAHGKEAITGDTEEGEENTGVKVPGIGACLKIPGVLTMCLLFIVTCAIECSAGQWGSTYMVEYHGLDPANAAHIVMFYYVGMALGRFFSGVLAMKMTPWQIITLGQYLLGLALLILLVPGPSWMAAAGLFMIGLGNGPMYPNFNYLTPEHFGKDISRSVMGIQMGASYAGIMVAPALCGVLGQFLGMRIFPFYLLLFYIILFVEIQRAGRIFRK